MVLALCARLARVEAALGPDGGFRSAADFSSEAGRTAEVGGAVKGELLETPGTTGATLAGKDTRLAAAGPVGRGDGTTAGEATAGRTLVGRGWVPGSCGERATEDDGTAG